MSTWDDIQNEAEWLAQQFRQRNVDLAEATKAGNYYTSKDYDNKAFARFLELMAKNPPPRSRRSQQHFKNLWDIWRSWKPSLMEKDKAYAWAWGVRLAKAKSVKL
jgi:hypothetical protein